MDPSLPPMDPEEIRRLGLDGPHVSPDLRAGFVLGLEFAHLSSVLTAWRAWQTLEPVAGEVSITIDARNQVRALAEAQRVGVRACTIPEGDRHSVLRLLPDHRQPEARGPENRPVSLDSRGVRPIG